MYVRVALAITSTCDCQRAVHDTVMTRTASGSKQWARETNTISNRAVESIISLESWPIKGPGFEAATSIIITPKFYCASISIYGARIDDEDGSSGVDQDAFNAFVCEFIR